MDNNPSAFPVNADNSGGPGAYAPEPGMTLRDWFAGQALVGILSDPARAKIKQVTQSSWVAEQAYAFADAMLTERANRPSQ